jgi:hypothetical protein
VHGRLRRMDDWRGDRIGAALPRLDALRAAITERPA